MTATVCRENWHAYHAPSPGELWLARLPGCTPVAAFADPDAAAEFARGREQAARDAVNPFRCGATLADITGLPAFALKDYLLDDGVKMAKPDSRAELHWDRWWARESPKWSPGTRARIWDALDRVRFFRVVARPLGGWAFVPVAAVDLNGWRPGHGDRSAPEGGRLLSAHAAEDDAAAALELFADGPETPYSPWPLRRARGWSRDPLAKRGRDGSLPLEPFDRVCAVPMHGDAPPRGVSVWCVARRAMTVAVRTDHNHTGPRYSFDAAATTREELSWSDASETTDWMALGFEVPMPRPRLYTITTVHESHLVPHAVYADRKAATLAAAELERQTRRLINPLRVVSRDAGLSVDTDRDSRGPLLVRQQLAELGLPATWSSFSDPAWWDAHAAPESDAVFGQAYDLFEGLRFAAVVELRWD